MHSISSTPEAARAVCSGWGQSSSRSLESDFNDQSIASEASSKTEQQGDMYTQRERKAPSLLRVVVIVVLGVACALLSVSTFLCIRDKEEMDFESHYSEYASLVLNSFQDRIDLKLAALDSLATDISSTARATGSEWPAVTVPDFEVRGTKTRNLANVLSLMFLPVVTVDTRSAWEDHSVKDQSWLQDSLDFRAMGTNRSGGSDGGFELEPISPVIFSGDNDEVADIMLTTVGTFLPLWQISPGVSVHSVYNYDMLSRDEFSGPLQALLESKEAVIGKSIDLSAPSSRRSSSSSFFSLLLHDPEVMVNTTSGPLSTLFYPILDGYQEGSKIVGTLVVLQYWHELFANVLPTSADGIIAVLENTCNQIYTFQINSEKVLFLGKGDLHDVQFNRLEEESNLADHFATHLASSKFRSDAPLNEDYCGYKLRVYPSKQMYDDYISNDAAIFSAVVAAVFIFVIMVVITYDCLVQRRQRQVIMQAVQSTTVLSPLFPKDFRDCIIQGATDSRTIDFYNTDTTAANNNGDISEVSDGSPTKRFANFPPKILIKAFLKDSTEEQKSVSFDDSKPIAELFPKCTVMFADIVGFTAWSSQREPAQVFTLLQNLYQAFDSVAAMRGVFNVETIGESYLAVTGLPDPQEDHAVIMAEFAFDCKRKMQEVTRNLERTLGPETSVLGMRFGLHSGPVVAGVLQGERSRFMIFGDTVNTAKRMESTGSRNLVQVSEATAALIEAAGKGRWIQPYNTVKIEGKGEMRTFWLETRPGRANVRSVSTDSMFSRTTSSDSLYSRADPVIWVAPPLPPGVAPNRTLQHQNFRIWGKSEVFDVMSPTLRSHSSDTKTRLIDWNVEVLLGLLKRVVARRKSTQGNATSSPSQEEESGEQDIGAREAMETAGTTALDEVREIITLPNFDFELATEQVDPESIELDEGVEQQLRAYITTVASMYRNNPFHNFEHACHVTMSIIKLLERVVKPEEIDYEGKSTEIASDAHNYTYGITSDSLTHFAVVFCALIHDVDHTGVSNGQLIEEKAHIATFYNNKSVAEQNSVDLAWELLMEGKFSSLRACIFTSSTEFKRFRQIVVNVVLATDIFDKELGALRKNRWIKAFDEISLQESPVDDANRKATIVMEHLIQASDVSHTMQHWHIYRKWNARLFFEMHAAYKSGRTDTDPSEGWYKGELGFFDNYVIPLAKKLKDCGVFGVSSDECLNYALENRGLWEAEGEAIVAKMMQKDYFSQPKRVKPRKEVRWKRRSTIEEDFADERVN
jgi:class 3 adenylate cyclase